MKKQFVYEIIDKYGYFDNAEDFEPRYKQIVYKVDDEDLIETIVELVVGDYFENFCEMINDKIKEFILNNGLLEKLFEKYQKELKDYYEDEAIDSYRENYR